MTLLERRDVPASTFAATGSVAGMAPIVTLQQPDGTVLTRFLAYDPSFLGGVSVAAAELNNDPNNVEIVTGAGPGGGPHVKVFSVDRLTGAVTTLASYFAYDSSFRGGVEVTVGNIAANQGTPVIITGAGPGGGPHVRSFTLTNGAVTQLPGLLGSFMAFDPTFAGGVRVAAGNLDGNALNGDELAVGAGPGGGPHVKVYGRDGTLQRSFFALPADFRGGVSLSVSTVTSVLAGSLIVAPGPGSPPLVRFYSPSNAVLTSFNAFDPTFSGGVFVGSITPTQVVFGAVGNSGAYTGFGFSLGSTVSSATILNPGVTGLPLGLAPFGAPDPTIQGNVPGFTLTTFAAGLNPFSQTGLTITPTTPVGVKLAP
jgi:hypothetical protein